MNDMTSSVYSPFKAHLHHKQSNIFCLFKGEAAGKLIDNFERVALDHFVS